MADIRRYSTACVTKTAVVCLMILGLSVRLSTGNPRPSQRQSWFGCEGETWNAKCDNSGSERIQRIRILRANYGRFSVSVCNPDGVSNWSTKCTSHTSLQVLTEKCNGKTACSAEVADKTFGDDPCPETFKYLEVSYECASEPVSTTRSLESFFAPTQAAAIGFQSRVFAVTTPSATTTASSSTTTTPTSPTTTTSTPQTSLTTTDELIVVSATKKTTASPVVLVLDGQANNPSSTADRGSSDANTVPRMDSVVRANLPGQSVAVLPQQHATEFCPEVMKQGIMWPKTPRGATDFQRCPRTTGYVQWSCDNSSPPQWKDAPNFSRCASAWIQAIQEKANADHQPEKLAEEFARQTASNSFAFGDDISGAVSFIGQIVNRGHRAMGRMSSDDSADPAARNLGKSLLKAGSNLLDAKHNSSWADLGVEARSETATSLIDSLESTTFMLADNVPIGSILVSQDANIVMAAGKLSMKNQVTSYRFPPYSEDNAEEKDMRNSIELPVAALQKYSRDDVVRVVFLSYNNVGQFLKATGDSSENDLLNDLPVNSRIVAAAINGGQRTTELKEPAVIVLEHLVRMDGAQPVCAFWNYKNSKSGFQGSWSTDGCRVVATDRLKTICSCDHLTNFAVLMDVTGTIGKSPHNDALTKITYIGCAISICCLAATLIIFVSFRTLQCERTTIHKNLAFCLMVAEIFFLAGITQTQLDIGCNVFSAIMHYFFLATFMWSLFEGINLWLMLVEVFDSAKSRRVWFYLAGYGIPLLIVAICLGVDWRSYRTADYCWLRADNYFILSFVVPVGLTIIANFGFLSVAMYYMCRNHALEAALHARNAHSWKHLKTWIAGAIGLAFLMGLTWVFGFLYIGNLETIIFGYIFTILNSFQGAFIFVLVCLRNDKVKSAMSQFLCSQRERFNSNLCTSTRSSSSFSDGDNPKGQAYYQTSTPLDKEQHYNTNGIPCYYSQRPHDTARRNTTTSILPPGSPNPVTQCTCHDHEKGSTRSSNRDSGHESVSCPSAESPPMQPHIHQRTSYPTSSAARKHNSKVLQSEYPAVAARINASSARRLYGDRTMYCIDPTEHIYAEIDPHQLEEEGCAYSDPSDESNTSMTYQRAASDVSTDDDHLPRMIPVIPCDKHFHHPSMEHKPLISSMGRMPLEAKSNPAFRSLSHGNPLRIRQTSPRQVPFFIPETQPYINSPLAGEGINVPVHFQHGNYNAFGLMSAGDGTQHVRRLPLMPKNSEQPLSYSEC